MAPDPDPDRGPVPDPDPVGGIGCIPEPPMSLGIWTQTHPVWLYPPPGILEPPGIPEPPTAVTFPIFTLPLFTPNPNLKLKSSLFSVNCLTYPLHFLSQVPTAFFTLLPAMVKLNLQVQVFLPTLTLSSSKTSTPLVSALIPTICWVITICMRTMGTHSHPSLEPIWPTILSSDRPMGIVMGAGQTGMLSMGHAPSISGQTFKNPGAHSPYPPPGMPDPDPVGGIGGIPEPPGPVGGIPDPEPPGPVGMPVPGNPDPDPGTVAMVGIPVPDPPIGMVVAPAETQT